MRRTRGGSATEYIKRNGIYIFLAMLFITILVLGGLVFFKRQERFTNPSERTLEFYYMKSCPHCTDFEPTWEKLKKELVKNNIAIKTVKYDLMGDGEQRANLFKVSGAPTILITDGDKLLKEYTGPRTVESLVAFVK